MTRVVWYHLETRVSLKLFAILLVSRFRRGRCARVPDASSSSRSRRRNVPPFKNVSYKRPRMQTDFYSPPPSFSHEDCIPERHDVTRRKEAAERETFDIAFLRDPVLPQRGAGSINRISGRSLIIHLCTPVRRMANPRENLEFSHFSRESHFRAATSFLPLLSLKRHRKLLQKDNETKDRTNDRGVRYSTLYCCEGSCRGREFLIEQRKLRAKKKKIINSSSKRFRI